MPPKKSSLSTSTAKARRQKQSRATESDEQHQARTDANRMQTSHARSSETEEHKEARLHKNKVGTAQARSSETQQHRQNRLQRNQINTANARSSETEEQRHLRLQHKRERTDLCRKNQYNDLHEIAFNYNASCDYSSHPAVSIGNMDVLCDNCHALKFKNEPPGMCCAGGKVRLPELHTPPEPLLTLVSGETHESKTFLTNIQKYNSSFQMTSFGATDIIRDKFMPTFKVQGQIYHLAGSLLPPADEDHKFLRIYFMGNSDNQIDQRCHYNPGTDREIVAALQCLLGEHNELIKLFKTALEQMPSDEYEIVIRADKRPKGQHERRYNAPTIDEVAIVIVGEEFDTRDIILHRRNKEVKRVSETHRSYDALQYPILFWQGEDGYHFNIKLIDPSTNKEMNKKVSAMNYYSYRLMIRKDIDSHILKCRQLFHQYVVDMYAKIESERLLYIRLNQAKLRSEEYIHLRDAVVNDGNVDSNTLGKMVILPSTFAGSPRHMHEYAQDAMTYYARQSSCDRHYIVARVFQQKIHCFMNLISKYHVYGEVRCWMYSIEWQKRGLPHAHILIWLVKKLTPDQVDQIISAEIPDVELDPLLFQVVTETMIHGPCGSLNKYAPCMSDGKCSKQYPRDLLSETVTGTDGYPLYRRRAIEHGGKSVILKVQNNNVEIDNRWIVPYSPLLSKIFHAHINVEYCNSVKSIKYICKYVNKGSDMAAFALENPTPNPTSNDEITTYHLGRYISSNEAVWRILSFPIHERYPTVVHLAVHLENGQRVYFKSNNAREKALTPPATTLTAFFSLCLQDTFAKTLLYSEVPKYYTWNAAAKKFQRRKQGKKVEGENTLYSTDALGRLYTVHPNHDECFYLRLLLINVRGPTSFQHLRTVHGKTCETYREACKELNLLENDSHWEQSLEDASNTASPHQIRTLFAILLTMCFPSNPNELWEKYKTFMSEDILHRMRTASGHQGITCTPSMCNEALILIEDICLAISNKSLNQLGIRSPIRAKHYMNDTDLIRETSYDADDLRTFVQANLSKLVPEQRQAYDTIMLAISNHEGGLYFLDAPGGTGKTFLISLILATIRAQHKIAIAVASSGIAATLLDGGRTAHAALKLPLNIQVSDSPTCNISRDSGMGKLLQSCEIIVWDECTMAHKKSLEALNRTMKDLRNNETLFGGTVILLSGDFRQTLPVIPRSTPADQLNACIKSSVLWHKIQKLSLTQNIRVKLQHNASATCFAEQLLKLGNGQIPIHPGTGNITIPSDFCNIASSTDDLLDKVFPNIPQNYKIRSWLSERAILAAKNTDVNAINYKIQCRLPGDEVQYTSVDTVMNQDEVVNYPTEFLNSLDIPGFPPHILKLKIGVPIILLRNINPPKLCNGTRLIVKKFSHNIIEATILNGKFEGEDVLLPRIPMIPTDMPFEFKRIQFPVRPAFAITINKAQGQSLQVCGIHLENACFSHGQLYVACSRVGKPSDLFIYTPDGTTKNIVYPKALQ